MASLTKAYDALHALTDFASGMTDRYAVKVADMLSPPCPVLVPQPRPGLTAGQIASVLPRRLLECQLIEFVRITRMQHSGEGAAMEQLQLDDLTFLILLAIFGIGGFIGTCSVMWRYYDMEPILRRRAPKLTTFLVTIGRWLEKVLSKVGPSDG